MYATLEGLECYRPGASDLGITDADVLDTEARVLAYISPRVPACEHEQLAVAHATYAQALYESDADAKEYARLKSLGLKSVTLSKFSAQFGDGGASMFPMGLVPSARAYLQNAGLLYRGVAVR